MKSLRILALMLEEFLPPESIEGLTDRQMAPWKTEYDVVSAIEDLGHEVRMVGVDQSLSPVRQAVDEFQPHIVFNLLEEFRGRGENVPYMLGYLELLGQAYTGCNPQGFMLSVHKALSKKLLRHHRILVPDFAVFPRGRRVKRPTHLTFPVIVKSTTEHGSVGITHASIVEDDAKLLERVAYIHEHVETDAIAEKFIDGRELYVGIIGNKRLQTLPIWEMRFKKVGENAPLIATEKVKWDLTYQEKRGILTGPARDLPEGAAEQIERVCKRAYRALDQTGYARMDLRLTPEGKIYLLESNPNPQLAYGEDFAESAEHAGIAYEDLIRRIISLGTRYYRELTA